MLHGKGKQAILTKTRESDRQEALEDRTGLTTRDLEILGLTGSQGGGETSSKTYEYEQNPFPIDSTIRSKKKIDIRKVKPELGEMSDE
jgi:hypothetical protein